MEYKKELVSRILRDVDDSVLALDGRGRIIYMNPQCQSLLAINDGALGHTYAEVFFDEKETDNDSFHQFIVDAVLEKEQIHKGIVVYTNQHNKKIQLQITASFLHHEDEQESGGVVLVLSDVTERETLRKKRYDASVVFSCITACVCLYLMVLSTLEFLKFNVPTKVLTQVINGMVCVIGFIIYKKTDFTFDELGLKMRNLKTTMISSLSVSLAVLLFLMVAKLVVKKIAPDFFASDSPFWNWNIGLYSWVSYIFTCTLQEFLARSLIYGSIKKMFTGKNNVIAALFLSALLFGALHIAHGFMYMMAATVLLGSFGYLYEKHGNIWGVTMIHFILGQAACCLGFLS